MRNRTLINPITRFNRDNVVVMDNTRRVNNNNSKYSTSCTISHPNISKVDGVYTCKSCLEQFRNMNKYVEHIKDCDKDDTKNECPICFNRMNSLAPLHKCYNCSNTIACTKCIHNIMVKDGKLIKDKTISCGIKCPFCRARMNVPLDVPSHDKDAHADIILHSINNLIKQNRNRKTIDKTELIKLLEHL